MLDKYYKIYGPRALDITPASKLSQIAVLKKPQKLKK